MSVDIVNPRGGSNVQSTPVEFVAKVTIRGMGVADVKSRFTIHYSSASSLGIDSVTDAGGYAKVTVPIPAGNYTWYVTAIKEGYPTIVSRSGSFTLKLSLLVTAVDPTNFAIVASPVDFSVIVTNLTGTPVGSANVTFFLDSRMIGSSLTDAKGNAMLSSLVSSGQHSWLAIVRWDGNSGVSDSAFFIVPT